MNQTPSTHNRFRWCGMALAPLCAAFLSGCAGSGIYPVEGKVVWKDGTPATELAGSHVIFDNPEKRTSSRGIIQANGTFGLTTRNADDGAPAGDYKVMIIEANRQTVPSTTDEGDATQLMPGAMDSRYSDPSTTDLHATITRGTNQITLTVDRNPRAARPK